MAAQHWYEHALRPPLGGAEWQIPHAMCSKMEAYPSERTSWSIWGTNYIGSKFWTLMLDDMFCRLPVVALGPKHHGCYNITVETDENGHLPSYKGRGPSDRKCFPHLKYVHSSSKETQLFWTHFARWPWVTDPDPGSCTFCQMILRVTCKKPVVIFLTGLSQS